MGSVRRAGLAVAGVLVAAPVAAQNAELRVEDAVTLAISRNERAKIADLNVTVAEAAVARARTAFLPTVLVNGAFTTRPDDLVDPKKTPSPILHAANSNGQAGVTVNQPLLNAPSFALYAQARQQ